MSTSAKVQSIDSIKEFRAYMVKFQESASTAMTEAESDINRTLSWLEGEQTNFWQGQLKKRQEALAKAEEALRFKRLYKDSSGSTPSAVDEMKAVQAAKKNLVEAQQKLANVKGWIRRLGKEVTLYRGGVARFTNDVNAGIPQAVAHLGVTIEMLEKYVGLGVAVPETAMGEAVGAGAYGSEGSAGAMSRAPDEAPRPAGSRSESAGLRKRVPPAEQLGKAEDVELFTLKLSFGQVPPEQRPAMGALSQGSFSTADGEQVMLGESVLRAKDVYLVRVGTPESPNPTWFMGSPDSKGTEVYYKMKAGDLRSARPDIAELLNLPMGWLVVFNAEGVASVWNQHDETVWQASGGSAKK